MPIARNTQIVRLALNRHAYPEFIEELKKVGCSPATRLKAGNSITPLVHIGIVPF
jgi:hypothetical protein